jgi:hypothetical protein
MYGRTRVCMHVCHLGAAFSFRKPLIRREGPHVEGSSLLCLAVIIGGFRGEFSCLALRFLWFVCTLVCIYARIYACVCVYTRVCMHVCMFAHVYVGNYVCVYVCMFVCTCVCMHVFMFARAYACMCVCLHVCMYAWVCISLFTHRLAISCMQIRLSFYHNTLF